jgi:hypothetical protein
MPYLHLLDLKNATIVSGGLPYYENYGQKYFTNDSIMGNNMFCNKENLYRVLIPLSTKSIQSEVFANCVNLRTTEIPDNVSQINNYSFTGCTGLSSVRVNCKSLSSCFKGLPSIKELYLHGVCSIGNSAFSNCNNLSIIELGDSLNTIGDNCFYSCTSLQSIRIPSKVNKIGNYSFAGCNNLSSIYSYNTTPPEIYSGTFDNSTEENANLYVPSGCKASYWIHPYWENYKHIMEFDTTGIQQMNDDSKRNANSIVYDLNGRNMSIIPFNSLHSGIYIINGKKYAKK